MPYHTGKAYLSGSSARRVLITDSSIMSSSLDMNQRKITSVGTPVRPLDAANKIYVDDTVTKVYEGIETQFSGSAVTLTGTEPSDIVNMQSGSYFVAVTPYDDGPTACFAISKASESQVGQVVRLTAHPGQVTLEQLELMWPRNGLLRLRKSGRGYDGRYLVNFNTKNVSSVPAPPVLPTDTATKAYVDERLEAKFGGVSIPLHGTAAQNVVNLRLGSYVMTVSPINIDGAPTATFSISKTSFGHDGVVAVITHCKGLYTPEELVLSWPADGMIALSKSGPGYDGVYLVDLGVKNLSTAPVAALDSDVATVAYVDRQIERKFQNRFGGQLIRLENTQSTPIFHMRPGAYVICVSSLELNGPCATFSVSKSSKDAEPHIVVLTSCPGRDTGERLQITWPKNSMILLSKTGPFYDGEYIADVPLKNLSVTSQVVVDSDVADKSYVDAALRQFTDNKFTGVPVDLTGTDFSAVVALRNGSYLVNVSAPHMDGAPTGSYIVSKARVEDTGFVVKLSECPGHLTQETLEVEWPPSSRLRLRKTGARYDGAYVVDFNLKNFATVDEPVVPDDVATKAYVDDRVPQPFTATFVPQVGSSADIGLLQPGMYSAVLHNPATNASYTFALVKVTAATTEVDIGPLRFEWNSDHHLYVSSETEHDAAWMIKIH